MSVLHQVFIRPRQAVKKRTASLEGQLEKARRRVAQNVRGFFKRAGPMLAWWPREAETFGCGLQTVLIQGCRGEARHRMTLDNSLDPAPTALTSQIPEPESLCSLSAQLSVCRVRETE